MTRKSVDEFFKTRQVPVGAPIYIDGMEYQLIRMDRPAVFGLLDMRIHEVTNSATIGTAEGNHWLTREQFNLLTSSEDIVHLRDPKDPEECVTADEYFNKPLLKEGTLVYLNNVEHVLVISHTGNMCALVNTSTWLTYNYSSTLTNNLYSGGITQDKLRTLIPKEVEVLIGERRR